MDIEVKHLNRYEMSTAVALVIGAVVVALTFVCAMGIM